MSDPKKTLISRAEGYLGEHEEGGDNCGPFVERCQKAVDGKADKEAWCVGFGALCVKETELGTGVKSPILWSESALEVWEKNPTLRSQIAGPGMLAVWQHAGTRKGHFGIVVSEQVVDSFTTIEGNTSGSGSGIERNGDKVARKNRSIHGSEKFVLLGFIDPFPSA